MINYNSILSAFDGKPTLLQWLKMVKKALDESILKNVGITQSGEKVVFTFNFEDGTSISTPEVTLPKGDKGDTGATGQKGDAGVSITGIDTVSNSVVGDETLTTLRANYSNNTTDEFVVTAKNGKDGGSNLYLHHIRISNPSYDEGISFEVYSSKKTLTLEDALAYVPTSENSDIHFPALNKIPVYFDSGNGTFGVASTAKFLDGSDYKIIVRGICFSSGTNNIKVYDTSFFATTIRDTLLGENL